MNIGGIDSSRIEAMMAQLKAAAQKPASMAPGAPGAGAAGINGALPGIGGLGAPAGPNAPGAASKVDFSDALKDALHNVSDTQNKADDLGKRFAAGDDSISLSDTMVAMQKANISFQASLQVRNKLVSAYHDIMNMQV